MVIKTNINVKRPNITSKRPGGLIYETGKAILQYYGYYEDIKQYDPGFYQEKYKYKTGKRVRSYIASSIQKEFQVSKRYETSNKFYKECGQQSRWSNWYKHGKNNC